MYFAVITITYIIYYFYDDHKQWAIKMYINLSEYIYIKYCLFFFFTLQNNINNNSY